MLVSTTGRSPAAAPVLASAVTALPCAAARSSSENPSTAAPAGAAFAARHVGRRRRRQALSTTSAAGRIGHRLRSAAKPSCWPIARRPCWRRGTRSPRSTRVSWRRIAALTASCVHSRLEFSWPSVSTTTDPAGPLIFGQRGQFGADVGDQPAERVVERRPAPRLQIQRRHVADRPVGVDDLVLGVELRQRHPRVARLAALPVDERVEPALGVGLDCSPSTRSGRAERR